MRVPVKTEYTYNHKRILITCVKFRKKSPNKCNKCNKCTHIVTPELTNSYALTYNVIWAKSED